MSAEAGKVVGSTIFSVPASGMVSGDCWDQW